MDVSDSTRTFQRSALMAVMLAAVVLAVFWRVHAHEFVSYDDQNYVVNNTHVTSGLSLENVRWAMTATHASNWHPVTWVSHMIDCELFGLDAGKHHMTSVVLHAANTALLFAALIIMTGAFWRAAVVAALFGLHPLHVESVAWIAERKDVLSTFFLLLVVCVWGWRAKVLRNASSATPGAGGGGATRLLYATALLLFALGLMAKPMLVTLPFVLLLVDAWPLRRFQNAEDARARAMLLVEKVPFVLLSGASCVVTLMAQRRGGAVASMQDFTLLVRVENAAIAYARYLGKCFFPADLSVFYPNFAERAPLGAVVGSVALLALVTALALRLRRRCGYVLAGWLWFLGTLVPVIGLVQVGGQAIADRYTYIPLIGIFFAVVWWLADLSVTVTTRRAAGAAAGVVLVALAALAWAQVGVWKNSTTLFTQAAAVTRNNWVAHHGLFLAYSNVDRAKADAHLQETLRILAEFAGRFEKKGIELGKVPGKEELAIDNFRTAIRIMRTLPGPHFGLALQLSKIPGREDEARAEFETVLKLDPSFLDAHVGLAGLLARKPEGRDAALRHLRFALRADPEFYEAHFAMGVLLMESGRLNEAAEHIRATLRLRPDFAPAQEILAQLERRGVRSLAPR